MALVSAARLADALERHGIDHASAFQGYHDKLSPFVDEVQERTASSRMALMFPTDGEMAKRDRQLCEGTSDL